MINCYDTQISKAKILSNLCYTSLVYGRINKKLGCRLSKPEIEAMILTVIDETPIEQFQRIGKNIYITNTGKNIKITINSNTYCIITVNKIKIPEL